MDEEGDIDPNKRKLTRNQRFKFTYNTQLIKENPYYLKDKSIKKFNEALLRQFKEDGDISGTQIKEFATVNGFSNKQLWIDINILMYQEY